MKKETTNQNYAEIDIDSSSSESDFIHPLQPNIISSSEEETSSNFDFTLVTTPPSDIQGDHNPSNIISNRTSERHTKKLKNKSSSTSNLESMRRRNNIDSNRKESTSSYSHERRHFDQRAQRHSRSLIIGLNSFNYEDDDYHMDDTPLKDPVNSPIPPPQISEFMSHDKDYVHFLLSGNHQGEKNHYGTQRVFMKQEQSSLTHLHVSNFCTWFSLIAVMTLILFGVLIEKQPLYIKGISPQRTPYVRVLHLHTGIDPSKTVSLRSDANIFSWVHFSGRLRMLDSYRDFRNVHNKASDSMLGDDHGKYISYEYVQEGKRYHERHLGDNIKFEMKKEAKIAFKTAALYFLMMILSIVYSHNHEYIRQQYRQWNLFGKLAQAVLLRRYFAAAYNRFKRRKYSDLDGGKIFSQGRMMRGGNNINIYYGNDDVGLSLPNKTKIGRSSRELSKDKYVDMISEKDSDEFVDHGGIQKVWDDVLGGSKSKKR